MIAAWYAPDWLTRPMVQTLEWFLALTGNYGLAIILLTVAVRVVILPLTIYQTKAMKRMQEVQPLMKEIQAKYKDQPEKLNQEMMGLYRNHGVNPFSGCLPLVVQMPFLYAIFAVLSTFTNVADPSFLWIPDLNMKDPTMVLPILTTVTMFVQSWLSGMGNDPNQKMMLWLMPLLFGYISFQMPQSGVVLYWVVSTLFGLAQQAIYPGFPRLKAQGANGEAGAK